MTRRTRYHHGNLRAALLDAALALLREQGPEALSLRAVARRAGVSQAAPYSHFADKRALLAAVAERGFRRLLAALDGDAPDEAPAVRLDRLGRRYVRFALDEPALFSLMFGRELAQGAGSPALQAAGDAAYDRLRRAVAGVLGGAPQETVETECVAAWSLVHGLAVLLMEERVRMPAEARAGLVDRITSGFAARLAAGRDHGRSAGSPTPDADAARLPRGE